MQKIATLSAVARNDKVNCLIFGSGWDLGNLWVGSSVADIEGPRKPEGLVWLHLDHFSPSSWPDPRKIKLTTQILHAEITQVGA